METELKLDITREELDLMVFAVECELNTSSHEPTRHRLKQLFDKLDKINFKNQPGDYTPSDNGAKVQSNVERALNG